MCTQLIDLKTYSTCEEIHDTSSKGMQITLPGMHIEWQFKVLKMLTNRMNSCCDWLLKVHKSEAWFEGKCN